MTGEARELFAALHPRRRRRRGSPRTCRGSCAKTFAGTMKHPARRRLPEAARRLPARPAHLHRRARRHRHGRVRVAHPGRRRQGVQARATTSRPSPRSSASNATEIEAHPRSCCPGPATGAPDALQRAARGADARRPSTSPRTTSSGPSEPRYHKALVDIISMVKHAAVETLAAADRRGARRRGRRHGDRGPRRSRRRAGQVDGVHPPAPRRRTSRSTAKTSTTIPVLVRPRRLGHAPNRVFDGQLDRAARTTSTRSWSPHDRCRRQALGLLPHPAPRRRRLRRLHRADHLPAVPQDGRRARRRAARATPTGRTCASRAAPTCSTPTSRRCARSASSRASSATSSPARRTASPTRSTCSKLIGLIDETEWTALDVDVKAAAFEGLLEKAASEGKKGAGQYFTPRVLIQSIVRCIKPDPRVSKDFTIGDPACGTGGFLVAAYEWLKDETRRRLRPRHRQAHPHARPTSARNSSPRPRRLALMNLYLHQVEPHITLGDSIYEAPDAASASTSS